MAKSGVDERKAVRKFWKRKFWKRKFGKRKF